MEKVTKIVLPVFGWVIYGVYTDSIERSRKERDILLGSAEHNFSEFIDGLHSYDKDRCPMTSYIFFTPKTTVGVIAHEAWHAIYRMFKFLDAKLENEVVAYHLTYIVDELINLKDIEDGE